MQAISAIDASSIHKITSGQVVIDLQTAVKELVENSLDAGSTNIEVRFVDYGLTSIQVIDNGTGIAAEDYDHVALKHHTSKLSSFHDLTNLFTFGFRGEALSAICALSASVSLTTATAALAPFGTVLEFDRTGRVTSKEGRAARQRGTTVTVSSIFSPLPVRRKELERNSKREFGKALNLLTAYALVPCSLPSTQHSPSSTSASSSQDQDKEKRTGVRLTVSNLTGGRKSIPIKTPGTLSLRSAASAIWGLKALDDVVDLDLSFSFAVSASAASATVQVYIRGVISRFAPSCGRAGNDRQFFYVNGRPCNPSKVQKVFNEVYRTFNATQSPLIVADIIIPTDTCDINVSPDKRTVLLHGEARFVSALKTALEESFAPQRATYDLAATQTRAQTTAQPSTQAKVGTQTKTRTRTRTDSDGDTPRDGQPAEEENNRQPLSDQVLGEGIGHSPLPGESEPDSRTYADATVNGGDGDDDVVMDDLDSAETVRGDKARAEPLFLPEPGMLQGETPNNEGSPDRSEGMPEPVVQPPGPPIVSNVTQAGHNHDRSMNEIHARNQTPNVLPSRGQLPAGRRTAGVQMVLNTSGAAWNLVPGSVSPAAKGKGRFSGGNSSENNIRERLMAFAKPGSQVPGGGDSSSKESKEGDEDRSLEDDEVTDGVGPRESARDVNRGIKRARSLGRASAVGDEDEDSGMVANAGSGKRRRSSHKEMGLGQDRVEDEMEVDELAEDDDPVVGVTTNARAVIVSDEVRPLSRIDGPGKTELLATRSSNAGVELVDLTDDAVNVDGVVSRVHSSSSPSVDIHKSPDTSGLPPLPPEVVRSTTGDNISLRVDMHKISAVWKALPSHTESQLAPSSLLGQNLSLATEAGIHADPSEGKENEERAAEALARVIDKKDFAVMEIVGQFNLGFIIVRLRKSGPPPCGDESTSTEKSDKDGQVLDDLFIVDQHAADEKYNFETLQQTTKIDSQRLFRPQLLELTASDEMLAIENMDVLQQNGFEVDVDANETEGADTEYVRRLKLVAQPISQSTVFDIKDLEELLHLMRDRPAGQMVRCSKARAMFAMRACRKSVMIGKPLTMGQMTSIVRHMGTMDLPWNCPHGRPTMRHLSDVGHHCSQNMDKSRKIDWGGFGPIS